MSTKKEITDLIIQQGVLPLYFNQDETVTVEILQTLYKAGVRAVEYTNRGDAALRNFKTMRRICDAEMKDMKLGVGTIKNGDMAAAFIDAGTDYIVCPGLVESVARKADEHQMLWIPGCMTPSEIIAAENLGAQFVKLFPGNLLGPEFMSTIKELFSGLRFMPTGGVDTTEENIAAWFKSGVSVVGMGSKLISKKIMEEKDWNKLQTLTEEVLATVAKVRSK